VIAGPNGSGKSTLTAMLQAEGVEFGDYLNADDIAREFGAVNEFISRKAQQIVRDRRNAALADGLDHAFETVMSHFSHIDYMLEAKRRGFEVRLYFVATDDPAINIDRVASRVARGGHGVPEDRVVARYGRCLANLPAAILAADYVRLYDNSASEQPLRQLAKLEKGHLVHSFYNQKTQPYLYWERVPVWWLETLLQIKPRKPFQSGPLS
jgi:predicted ABC-type ATPase